MIILMGLAGSGKSTQGQILAKEMGREWLSAGQILRDSGEFQETLDEGKLVDDSITIKMMADAMVQAVRRGENAILDGFPRDIDQAEWMAENIASVIELIIRIEVPKDELLQRIALRGREDDTEEALRRRFEVVEKNINAVCEILGQKGIETVMIDGVGTMEEVTERIREKLHEAGVV